LLQSTCLLNHAVDLPAIFRGRKGPGQDNVNFKQRDLAQIDAIEAYDVIAVTASLPAVPENLKQALKMGGRMFVIIGSSPVMQAVLITRDGEAEWTTQSLFETDLPRLKL